MSQKEIKDEKRALDFQTKKVLNQIEKFLFDICVVFLAIAKIFLKLFQTWGVYTFQSKKFRNQLGDPDDDRNISNPITYFLGWLFMVSFMVVVFINLNQKHFLTIFESHDADNIFEHQIYLLSKNTLNAVIDNIRGFEINKLIITVIPFITFIVLFSKWYSRILQAQLTFRKTMPIACYFWGAKLTTFFGCLLLLNFLLLLHNVSGLDGENFNDLFFLFFGIYSLFSAYSGFKSLIVFSKVIKTNTQKKYYEIIFSLPITAFLSLLFSLLTYFFVSLLLYKAK